MLPLKFMPFPRWWKVTSVVTTGLGPHTLQGLISKVPSAFCVRGRTLVILKEGGPAKGATQTRAV